MLAYNADVNGERQALISEALNRPGRSAANNLDSLIGDLGMPRSLREVGIDRDLLPQLAENCMLDDWTFSNPKPLRTPADVMQILESAL